MLPKKREQVFARNESHIENNLEYFLPVSIYTMSSTVKAHLLAKAQNQLANREAVRQLVKKELLEH